MKDRPIEARSGMPHLKEFTINQLNKNVSSEPLINKALYAPSGANISVCLWAESLVLLQFVPESELSLIE